MTKRIKITTGVLTFAGELNDSSTAAAIWSALPLEGSASRWGKEFYFSIPVSASPEEGAREKMEVGELAYWPPGNAFCIFFGPTPVSHDTEPRAASPCNPVGMILAGREGLSKVPQGATFRIEQA